MNEDTLKAALVERYQRAAHGVQSAIAFLMNRPAGDFITSPKHTRVGIDLQRAEQASVAKLLVRKGLITELEYIQAITEGAEAELASYTERARKETGIPNLNFG